MNDLFSAFSRAARDLFTPAVFWRVLWPPFAALASCIAVGLSVWQPALAQLELLVPTLPWTGFEWVAQWAAMFLLIAGFVALFYFTTILLVAIVVLPGLITRVARQDYPDLGRHGENVFIGSLLTTLGATLVYLIGGLLSLPLLLIPGAILVVPLVWTGWVNQRTFRFDALAEHATRAELAELIKADRGGYFLAGVGCAALAHVPVVNFLVPGYTALVFVHLGLQRLRALRSRQGVQV